MTSNDVVLPDQLPHVPGGWTERRFAFGDRTVTLFVPANPDALLDDADVLERNRVDDYMPYWAYLWPAAVTTAAWMADRETQAITGRTLEIGCGLGLVGIVWALRHGSITLSDYDADAVTAALINARANGLTDVRGTTIDWRQPTGERFERIIGCDLVYETRLHEPLLSFLKATLTATGIAWIADPGRIVLTDFLTAANEAGFTVTVYDPATDTVAEPRVGSARVVRLSRQDSTADANDPV